MNELHMDCHELLGLLSDYVDGELEANVRMAIEQHMAECERCRVVVNTLRKTITLYHRLSQETVTLPEDVRERLFRRLQQLTFPRGNG